MKIKWLLAALLILSGAALGQVTNQSQVLSATGGTISNCWPTQTAGAACGVFTNLYGAKSTIFEEVPAGSPTTVSVSIYGCMRGGTCDAVADNNTSTTKVNRPVAFSAPYDVWVAVAITLTGGTAPTITLNLKGSTASSGGANVTGQSPIVVTGSVVSCPTCGTSTGTVTGVSVVTANGVSGTVATPTTTPAITLTLGAITPTSVAPTAAIAGAASAGPVSYGTLGFTDTNLMFSGQANVNSFAQMILQNTNAGTTASTDYVVNNDQGTATTHYGDFGINSSGFSGTGNLNIAGEAFLTSTTGDLGIGTTTANAVHFCVNNCTTDAAGITSSNVFNLPAAGFSMTGATTAGHYQRNNGTNFVDSAIVVGDLPVAIPIGSVGSAGLSATGPVRIASTGVIDILGSGTVAVAQGGTGVSNTATLTLGSSNVNLATLGTGIVKNTTTTGALSVAVGSDLPTAIPIASVGSAGLSATGPVRIASTGVIDILGSGTVAAAQGGTGVSNTATLTLGSSNQNWATLGTGIVKNTTTTGALSVAVGSDLPSAIPIGSVGSAGLSGTAPVAIASTGVISLSGSAGQVPNGATGAFTATPTLGVQNTTQGTLTIAGSAASAGQLLLNIAGASANATTITPGANAGAITLTLPIATGTLLDTAGTNAAAASMTLDLSAITTAAGFKVPVAAGCTASADGAVCYDSTNKNTHVRANGADTLAVVETAAVAANKIMKAGSASVAQAQASSITDSGTVVTTAEVISGGNTVRLTADSSGITATTPGTTFLTLGTLAANTNYSFTCEILYSQATAAVLDGLSVQAATNAATDWDAWGTMYTADPVTGTVVGSQSSALRVTTTTATPIVTATPAATGTVYQARLSGNIQVGASVPTMNILAFTGSASDALTIKAGTFCSVFV